MAWTTVGQLRRRRRRQRQQRRQRRRRRRPHRQVFPFSIQPSSAAVRSCIYDLATSFRILVTDNHHDARSRARARTLTRTRERAGPPDVALASECVGDGARAHVCACVFFAKIHLPRRVSIFSGKYLLRCYNRSPNAPCIVTRMCLRVRVDAAPKTEGGGRTWDGGEACCAVRA